MAVSRVLKPTIKRYRLTVYSGFVALVVGGIGLIKGHHADLWFYKGSREHDMTETAVSRFLAHGANVSQPRHSSSSRIRLCTQQEREKYLLDYCSRHPDRPQDRPRLYVLEDQRTLYCHIPKVAGTSLKTILVMAAAKNYAFPANSVPNLPVHAPGFLEKRGISTLKDFSTTEQKYILENYYKIIVVKHPLSRLLSTWRDKFLDYRSPYRLRTGMRIMKLFRNHSEDGSSAFWSSRPHFEEFLKFLSKTRRRDRHWNAYEEFCHPCSVSWDAILRTETLDLEAHILLDRLRLSSLSSIPIRHSNTKNQSDLYRTSVHLPEYESVPSDVMNYVMNIYEADMKRFGYTWDRQASTGSCIIDTKNGPCC